MTINEVHNHFKGNWAEAMRKLYLCRSTYNYWNKIGHIPFSTQQRIEIATKKKLKAVKHVD